MGRGRREIRDRGPGGGAAGNPFFWAFSIPANIDRAPDRFDIGGTLGDLAVNLNGRDYPWSGFSEVENGNAITEADSPLQGREPGNAVKFNDGDYLRADESDYCDIGTKDLIAEFCGFGDVPASWSPITWIKFSSNPQHRIYQQIQSSGYILGVIWDDPLNAQSYSAHVSSHCFVCIYYDRSGNLRLNVNGSWAAAADISSFAALDVSGGNFEIGDATGLTSSDNCYSSVARLRVWLGAAWIDGTVETEIEKRFFQASGLWPRLARGTWAPTAFTRACAAYLEMMSQGEKTKLYLLGANLPRISFFSDGPARILSECQRTNRCEESEDLATTWAATRCTISQDAIAAPDTMGLADGIVASSDDDTHYISISPTLADTEWHCFSGYLRAGAKSWAKITLSQAGGDVYAYFNLSTGAVGTKSGGLYAYVLKEMVDGWWRVYLYYTADNPDTVRIGPAHDDNDDDFSGDDETISIYVWGEQFEQGHYPTSYIPTDGAIATRLADENTYRGDDGNVPSSGHALISFDVICVNPDWADDAQAGETEFFFALSDGGSTDDCIAVYIAKVEIWYFLLMISDTATPVYCGLSFATLTDGEKHHIEVRYDTDYMSLKMDSSTDEETVGVVIPDNLDQIEIGHQGGAYQSSNFLISDFKILPWSLGT